MYDVYVKRGFAGEAYLEVNDILNSNHGSLPISIDSMDDNIKYQNERIEREESRLEREEQRLIEKYARLEKFLSEIQSQFSAAGLLG